MGTDTTFKSSLAAKVVGRWPEGAIVYHIYPRSLQDSTGDGVGDLPGIIRRLDYIKSLGANAVWLSPFYPSPMADFGYDVVDYCDVDPLFGTLDDFKALLAEAAKRGIRVMIDLVPNHTSDEHAWFRQSRASAGNRYADWYVWRDAKALAEDGRPLPPNNWLDMQVGQSAWQWDDGRRQFYLHSFGVKQPDLNWSNSAVREVIKNVMRFWLDLGVDGFRVDAVYSLAKDPMMRDDPPAPGYVIGRDPPYAAHQRTNSCCWPAVYAYLSEISQVLKEEQYRSKSRFIITEAYPVRDNPIISYLEFYAGVDPLVAAPNFEAINLGWDASVWRRFLGPFHAALQRQSPLGVVSYALGNHDLPRLASRVGEAAARSAAVLLLTLPGMVFIYYGEEIGMRDVHIPPDRVRDPNALGDPARGQGRDPERTPMQWTAGKNAGFSDAALTWLPLSPDYNKLNAESQEADPSSMLALYRTLGKLRNTSDALKYGAIEVLDLSSPHILGYIRSFGNEHYLILVNFGAKAVSCKPAAAVKACILSSVSGSPGTRQTGRADNPDGSAATPPIRLIRLRPHEAAVFALS